MNGVENEITPSAAHNGMNGAIAVLNYGGNDDYMEEEPPTAAPNLQIVCGISIIENNLHMIVVKAIHEPHEEFKK